MMICFLAFLPLLGLVWLWIRACLAVACTALVWTGLATLPILLLLSWPFLILVAVLAALVCSVWLAVSLARHLFAVVLLTCLIVLLGELFA